MDESHLSTWTSTTAAARCVNSLLCRSSQQENGCSWRRRRTWTPLETPGTRLFLTNWKFSVQSFTAWFHPNRVWETAKRTTRQVNTDADGERLCCEPWTVIGCLSSSCNPLSLQVLESLPCWSGRSTKTAWWWWSSSVLLWDATLWSFRQVRCLPNNLQKIFWRLF